MKSPQQSLIFLTNRVGRQLARLLLEEMEFEGFVPQATHMGLLADLVERDGMRQQDLAIASIKDKATVARGLSQLEDGGMLRREVDPDDRRQKRIYLTEKGRRLWMHAKAKGQRTMVSALADVPQQEHEVCLRVLQQIYGNLNQRLNTPKQTPSYG